MFDRLRRVFSPTPVAADASCDELAAWADRLGLQPVATPVAVQQWEGVWQGAAWVCQRGPSTRPYISGVELSVKADLGLRSDVRVVLMHRSLKRSLQALGDRLFSEVTDALQTTDKPLPEEVGWLSLFRDAGWAGPPDVFWDRFAVLTDMADHGRHWLDEARIDALQTAAQSWHPELPIWWGILRGKLYMRTQWTREGSAGVPASALQCCEQFAHRAQAIFSL